MKRKMLSTIVLVCLAAAVQARLGDSFKQSITRFGKPLGHFKDKYAEVGLFEKVNFAILVKYHNGKSFQETYALLQPGIKRKIDLLNFYNEKLAILDNVKNLKPMAKNQISSLLKANGIIVDNNFEINSKNNTPCRFTHLQKTAVYYPVSKLLIVKAESPPSKSVGNKEIAMTNLLPLGLTIDKYCEKYGTPFYISSDRKASFLKNNLVIIVGFDNENNNDKSLRTIRALQGLASKEIMYKVLTNDVLEYYIPKIQKAKIIYSKFKNKLSMSKNEDDELFNCYVNPTGNIQFKISFSLIRVKHFLSSSANTKWHQSSNNLLCADSYWTWFNGRKIYGTYNIFNKTLCIKYGTKPSDFQPEVIKKLKEKKATEALEGF